MILSESEAKNLLTKVLNHSTVDGITAVLSGGNAYNIRFARNSPSTNGFSDSLSVSITSYIGKKSGSTSTNKFDDDSIKAAVKKSETIARLAPDNKEFMPLLGAQSYSEAKNYSANTENMESTARSGILSYVISESIKNDVVSAGYLEDNTSFMAVMNSNGLFAYNKESLVMHSATARTKEGSGSSRFEKHFVNVNDLDYTKYADFVITRSKLSVNPAELKPGRYTVILEPTAVADMIAIGIDFMGSRAADEGRSFFSKAGGGNRIGETLADSKVNIYSDPADNSAPSVPFTSEGFPRMRTAWFENGVLKNLHRNRFWAEKTSSEVVPYPSNLIMTGTDKTTEQIIADTDYGVLITRLWYIRTVEQKTMLLTGLTRDGVFEVRDGKIVRPVKNFRFNESPINVLKNVVDIGKAEKSTGAETDELQISVPALKVANFNLSSLSDAI
jgi:predicted Zn-dependent protease